MCSYYFLYKFLSYVFSYIMSFVGHAHTYPFENETSFPPLFGQLSGGFRLSDKGGGGGGQSSRPWDKGGAGLQKFFSALRASVWSKNKGSVFFRQWTKKSPFSKISGYVWTRPESVKKTTPRKSSQFVRKKSGYSGKKRMDGSLRNFWIALRD